MDILGSLRYLPDSVKKAAACKSDSPLFVFYAILVYANGFSVLYGTLAG